MILPDLLGRFKTGILSSVKSGSITHSNVAGEKFGLPY